MSVEVAQWRRLCGTCGQTHPAGEPHLYNYGQEVDEDLTCHICLQPLVSPTDTKCGHTFCRTCITSYLRIQHLCPVDRQPLTPHDCQPASLMVRRLLDKLEVECPNATVCHTRLPRSELEPHLSHRCPGALFPCPKYGFGCRFEGTAQQLEGHVIECQYHRERRNGGVDVGSFDAPIQEGHISRVEIPRNSSHVLGMSIVGGYDSPLRCVIVQDVHPGGAVAQHGRLQPGDQLLEVNGKDLTHCPHNYVISLLKSNVQTVQLSVYREQVDPPHFGDQSRPQSFECSLMGSCPSSEVLSIGLDKHPGRSLGIKLTEKRHRVGVFISEVVEGSVAALDGRLRADDKILEINSQDMRRSKIEEASLFIQMSSKHIEFLVSRGADASSSPFRRTSSSPVVGSQQLSTNMDSPSTESDAPPLPPRNSPQPTLSSCGSTMDAVCQRSDRCGSSERQVQPRYVTISKNPYESLGIRVAGGLESQQGNTPVYIQNVAPHGCLGRSRHLKKGDILLSVNLTSLLGITHSEAVASLKVAANGNSLTLGIVDGPETSQGPDPFTPTWMYWQKLPRSLHLSRTVVLRRPSNESLGFSLVGGRDGHCGGEMSFHVLLIVRDSIAAKEGQLRCGDQILSVNGYRLDGLRHCEAVNLLKTTRSKVLLEILSWPGTVV